MHKRKPAMHVCTQNFSLFGQVIFDVPLKNSDHQKMRFDILK